ncbi:MAG: hypothetical protein ACLGHQ_01125, partial [Acidimicrobiia bacterium]
MAVTVLVAGGDDAPPDATVDPDDLASALTVPPTLTPVTEPVVTLPPYPGAPIERGLDEPSLVAASVETLPPLTGTTIPQPDTFRLSDGSLAALDAPLARRSVTDHMIGVDGFDQTVTITNDPSTGRYLLEVDTGTANEQVTIDVQGGLTYVEVAPGEWVTEANDVIAERIGAPDLATFLRDLQLGPIRSDTRDAWTLVQQNGIVAGGRGEPLGEWVVVLDAAAVPEWARYAFGPTGDAPPVPGTTPVGFAVYVGANGAIRRVTGSTEYGATEQRIVHRIEELDEPPVIELPDVATEPPVTEPPVTEPVDGPTTTAPPG